MITLVKDIVTAVTGLGADIAKTLVNTVLDILVKVITTAKETVNRK